MSDLIDRQAAIATAISGRVRTLPTTEDGENWIRVNEVRDSLLSLPTAQPKRGKWIDREEVQDYIKVKRRICSVCYREPSAWSSRKKFKYCPNCGARME